MLSSIHPFGERSRNNRFWLTASAHILGSLLGGVALGLLAGLVGWISTFVLSESSVWRAIAIACIALFGAALEAAGRERSMPMRSRQVNENWIQQYRGWVYGGAFGFELGFGVSTIITTTLVHVAVAAMVLVGSVPLAVAIGAVFGATRGATVLGSAAVRSPNGLRSLHRQLARLGTSSRSAGIGALVLAGVVGLSAVVG